MTCTKNFFLDEPLRRRRSQRPQAPGGPAAGRLSKKWLAPLFRGVHSSLAPTARPGSYAEKPLLRKAFCGFAVHAAKSDYSLRGLRPPNPQGFFDRLKAAQGAAFQGASRPAAAPPGGWGMQGPSDLWQGGWGSDEKKPANMPAERLTDFPCRGKLSLPRRAEGQRCGRA